MTAELLQLKSILETELGTDLTNDEVVSLDQYLKKFYATTFFRPEINEYVNHSVC